MKSSFIPIALAIGIMLSPESLILLGNNVGLAGISFLGGILVAVLAHIFTAISYGKSFELFPGQESEILILKESLGSLPAIVFPLCSRVAFTIFFSTAILAASRTSPNV